MSRWIHCDDCAKNGTDDCPHLMNDEIRVSSCKDGVPKEAPPMIVEQTFIKGDRVMVREYDANAPSVPPTKKQVCFPDPFEEGCVCVDWSKDKQEILALLGIEYSIFDPNEGKEQPDRPAMLPPSEFLDMLKSPKDRKDLAYIMSERTGVSLSKLEDAVHFLAQSILMVMDGDE